MEASVTMNDVWTEFIRTRRSELRDELITAYAPLVRFVVGRLGVPPSAVLDTDDLMGYGMIGLINAIDRYDPERGVRFEAFATPRIRGAVIDQLRQLNWLPRSAVSRVRHIEGVLANLEQRLGRPAREEEVAEEMGVSTDRYRQMLVDVSGTVLSLDAPLGSAGHEEEQALLGDLIEDAAAEEPGDQVEREELINALAQAIERLPQREQLLLSLYYKEELTMKEVSKVMGVSESRVCQLHMQAVMRLRGILRSYLPGEAEMPGKLRAGMSGTHKVYQGGSGKKKEGTKIVAGTSIDNRQRVS